MKIYFVNSFFPSLDKAKEIGKIVLKRKLAACVNINDKIKSFFWWKNKLSNENEVELSFKTSFNKVTKLIEFLEKNHPYECPCIIAFKVDKANKKYINWVLDQTK